MKLPTIDDVREAHRRIRPYIHCTPVLRSSTLNRRLGAEVFFKAENFQKVGAFKARGAVNAALSLSDTDAAKGLITHSSGNHAAAVAYAASIRGIAATVVMPEDAPPIKVAAVRGYGAKIVFSSRSDREEVCERERERTGATFIHPFTHPAVIAGQGTAALELLEEVPDLDLLIAPVGGGGLMSGTAIASTSQGKAPELWGAEPFAVDDAYRSLETGVLQPGVQNPQTACDGLLTGLGAINFEILKQHSVRILRVEEQPILDAARFVLERMKVVIEPSCATVVAALLLGQADPASGLRPQGRRIGAILSGGNTDFAWLDRAGTEAVPG